MLEQKRMVDQIKAEAAAQQAEAAAPPPELPEALKNDDVWKAMVNMFMVEAMGMEHVARTEPNVLKCHSLMDQSRCLRMVSTFLIQSRPDLFPQKQKSA